MDANKRRDEAEGHLDHDKKRPCVCVCICESVCVCGFTCVTDMHFSEVQNLEKILHENSLRKNKNQKDDSMQVGKQNFPRWREEETKQTTSFFRQ